MQFFLFRSDLIPRQTLLAMKFFIFFLVFGLIQVSAETRAQNVTISGNEIPLKKVFKDIERQANYVFFYDAELLKIAKPVTIHVKNTTVEKALDLVFANQPLSWTLVDKTVTVVRKHAQSSLSQMFVDMEVPYIQITGKVTDEDGRPLEGVSVVIEGATKKGTSTDNSGRYSLEVQNENNVLEFSMIGYTSRKVTVGTKATINVTLIRAVRSMDEMVIIGYGKADKLTYTGSVSSIGADEIVKNKTANVTDALIGRLPGLTAVRPDGGDPGSSANLTIRGMNTINDGSHNNSPLIIVDGVERTSSNADVLSLIDPNNIENISVLKDASASAVYGARAANGVILITTKRGLSSKPEITYNFVYQNQRPTRLPKPLDSWEWAALYNEAQTNDARLPDGSIPTTFKPLYSETDIQKFKDGSDPDHFANTNWLEEVLMPSANEQQHNLGVRGGNDAAKYFVSVGYTDQGGFIKTYNYKRYNLLSNVDVNVNNTLNVSVDIAGTFSETLSPTFYSYTVFGDLLKTSPIYPNKLESDPTKYAAVQNANSIHNPYLQAYKNGYNNRDNTTLFSTLKATQKIDFLPGLSVTGLLSFNKSYGHRKSWQKKPTLFTDDGMYYKDGIFNTASLTEESVWSQNLITEARLDYNQSIGGHQLGGLLVFTQSKNYDKNVSASKNTFLSTALDELFAGETEGQSMSNSTSEFARRGLVGRLIYNFDQKYLFEANFRYDGSSNFPPEHRWGFFPSFAAGWNISKENFIKNNPSLSFIDLLKLRGSWGKVGNDWTSSSFAFLNQFSVYFGKTTIDDKLVSILLPSALANPGITWEKANTTNVGFEMNLWKGLFGIEADFFVKRTTDILAQPTLAVPETFGASLPLLNEAIVDNKGFEITVTHQRQFDKFYYRVRPNIAFSSSRIVYMPENQANENLRRSGRTQDYFTFGYQAIGLFQSYEEITKSPMQTFGAVQPGDIKYADISGPDGVPDGKIDAFDRTRIGNSNVPQIIYGIAMDAGYKGFDISALLQGVGRSSLNFSGDPGWAFATQLISLGSVYEHHRDRWTPENTDASYPRLFLDNLNNQQTSSYWVKKGNYLRLKNITVGYTFPKSILGKVKLNSVRIYAGATNLFTWDKIKIFDPEMRGGFSTGGYYPMQKTFNIGLSLKF